MSKILAAVVLCISGSARAASWVAGNSTQGPPENAVAGGWTANGTLEYLCRGSWGGGVHPGRMSWNGNLFSTSSSCTIGYGGQQIALTSYETLTDTWQAVTNSSAPMPAGAMVFGHDIQQADGSTPPFYVCRGHDASGVRPGKIRQGWGGCSVGTGGHEVFIAPYDVLIGTFPLTQIPVTSTQPRPNDILMGGSGVTGGSLWLCAAQFGGGVHPGSLDIGGVCHFGFGGAEQTVTATQGYIALTPRWINISPGLLFQTGNEADATPLYTCRAEYPVGSHAVYAGKWQRSFSGCHIGANNSEIEVTSTWYLLDNPVFLVPPR